MPFGRFYEGSAAGRGFGSGDCRGIRLQPRKIQTAEFVLCIEFLQISSVVLSY